MNQDISKAYNALGIGNLSKNYQIRLLKPAERFTDVDKSPFNRRFNQFVAGVCFEIHVQHEFMDSFAILHYVEEMCVDVTFHKS